MPTNVRRSKDRGEWIVGTVFLSSLYQLRDFFFAFASNEYSPPHVSVISSIKMPYRVVPIRFVSTTSPPRVELMIPGIRFLVWGSIRKIFLVGIKRQIFGVNLATFADHHEKCLASGNKARNSPRKFNESGISRDKRLAGKTTML